MRVLVIGCNGQLGYDMILACRNEGHDVQGIDFPEIDITNAGSAMVVVSAARPEVIINCAAYTAVDAAESNEEQAYAVNAFGTANLAAAAEACGAAMVHFSTDYVFDGCAKIPYVETDPASPVSVYGKSKLEGEKKLAQRLQRHIIIRLAWLYGTHGRNFVTAIRDAALKKARSGEPLLVVNDQFGTPTWTRDVCRQTMAVISAGVYGIFHGTSEGECCWFDFAGAIVESAGIEVDIRPCTTAQFPRPAPRPAYGVLENRHLKKLGLNLMPPWRQGFESFLRSGQE